jgi:hypothetical protein
MPQFLKFLIVIIGFLYGIVCIYRPMWIVSMGAWWTKLGLGNLLFSSSVDPQLQDALRLVDTDPGEFQRKYAGPMARIKLAGIVALVVCSVGLCIMIYGS